MKHSLCFFLVYFLFFIPGATAQKQGQALVDSLMAVLPNMNEDTSKVNALATLGAILSGINPVDGLKYSEDALALAHKLQWQSGQAKGNGAMASNYLNLRQGANAEKYSLESLRIYETLKDENGVAGALLALGNLYEDFKADLPHALDYYFKSLKKFESLHNDWGIGKCNFEIGVVYIQLNQNEKAIQHLSVTMQIAKKLKDVALISLTHGRLGNVYFIQGKLPEAEEHCQKALDLAMQLGIKTGIEDNSGCLGLIYFRYKQYQKALNAFQKALTISNEISDLRGVATWNGNIGSTYLQITTDSTDTVQLTAYEKTVFLHKSLSFLGKAINGYKQINDLADLKEVLFDLSKAQSLLGNYKASLDSYKEATLYKDSLFNADRKETIKNLEDKREIELRDKQIQISHLEIGNQKRQRWMYICGLGFLAVIGGLFFLQSRQRKKANLQLSLSNQQLDEANRVKARFFGILSHDLRAPIANLTNYLHLQREEPELMDAQSKASHQLTIENTANNLLSVMEDLLLWSKGQMAGFKLQIKSILILQLFDEIKKLIPADIATNVVFIDPGPLRIDTDENFLKTIMRNLTSNALRILDNRSDGMVEWKAWEADGNKYLSVTDNGPGFSKEEIENLFTESAITSSKTGLGLLIIRDFVQMLGQRIEVKSELGKGTSFVLSSENFT